jgi:hypothetical protein
MKLTKNHKIIIGVVGLGILAYATKKYWMPKKKTTVTTPTAGVKTQSAPTSTPAPAISVAPKRTELIAKLKGFMKDGTLTLNLDDSFFNTLTDKELQALTVMREFEKAESDVDEEAILKKNNITPNDLKVIGEKMKSYFDKLKKYILF